MKPTTKILLEIYNFAKANELKVLSISSHQYENIEEFSVKFERGGEEWKQKNLKKDIRNS